MKKTLLYSVIAIASLFVGSLSANAVCYSGASCYAYPLVSKVTIGPSPSVTPVVNSQVTTQSQNLGSTNVPSQTVSANQGINGQLMTSASLPTNLAATPSATQFSVTAADPTTGQPRNIPITATDPISNVPAGLYIAHVMTSSSATIDVQRFIDPSTNVACYYSEFPNGTTLVNCVTVPANSI
jgi:hypothetical protein